MDAHEMIRACLDHTLYSWSATARVEPLPIARAEGVHFYDPDGKRYLDFNSQLMSVLIGHQHPKVVAAMKRFLDTGPIFAWPGSATLVRARLGERLARLLPGDLNTFFFTLGGADANEAAIRAARQHTGRHKILSSYRSYHGGSLACLHLTGDYRRIAVDSSATGFVHVLGPWPHEFRFAEQTEDITEAHLRYLEETIRCEGAETIAAMFVESVTGTNGVLAPPKGWLAGLKALLHRYGILLVCDEVMSGFGRTGRWFAFEHGDIVPDMVTMAKGLTSSYAPLGALAVSDPIAAHFRDHVLWAGLTYNAHPLSLATALAVLDVMEEERLVERAAALAPVMAEELERLRMRHPSVKVGRSIGLFGLLELQRNGRGDLLVPFRGSHPAMGALRKDLLQRGLFTLTWESTLFCNPPLTITQAQLREGFAIIDASLSITDAVYEG
jgi:taurine--2-oxoglutarate transaminase